MGIGVCSLWFLRGKSLFFVREVTTFRGIDFRRFRGSFSGGFPRIGSIGSICSSVGLPRETATNSTNCSFCTPIRLGLGGNRSLLVPANVHSGVGGN